MNISKNSVVSMDYTLKDDVGETLDTSVGAGPLAFIQGTGQIIPGLENALEEKKKGEKLSVVVKPEDGYGERHDEMIQSVPKSEFEEVDKITLGAQFQSDTPQGPMVLTVIEIKDDEFVLDANHPLAGVTLHFDVEIIDVREATKEELEHGHVHGVGGHQH